MSLRHWRVMGQELYRTENLPFHPLIFTCSNSGSKGASTYLWSRSKRSDATGTGHQSITEPVFHFHIYLLEISKSILYTDEEHSYQNICIKTYVLTLDLNKYNFLCCTNCQNNCCYQTKNISY